MGWDLIIGFFSPFCCLLRFLLSLSCLWRFLLSLGCLLRFLLSLSCLWRFLLSLGCLLRFLLSLLLLIEIPSVILCYISLSVKTIFSSFHMPVVCLPVPEDWFLRLSIHEPV